MFELFDRVDSVLDCLLPHAAIDKRFSEVAQVNEVNLGLVLFMQHLDVSLLHARLLAQSDRFSPVEVPRSLLTSRAQVELTERALVRIVSRARRAVDHTVVADAYLDVQELALRLVARNPVRHSVRVRKALEEVVFERARLLVRSRHANSERDVQVLNGRVVLLQQTAVLDGHLHLIHGLQVNLDRDDRLLHLLDIDTESD